MGIRLLVSSKSLAQSLKEFNVSEQEVQYAFLRDEQLNLCGAICNVAMDISRVVLPKQPKMAHIEQYGARWDWVYKLVKSVSEQPIVIEIHKGRIQIIFQY